MVSQRKGRRMEKAKLMLPRKILKGAQREKGYFHVYTTNLWKIQLYTLAHFTSNKVPPISIFIYLLFIIRFIYINIFIILTIFTYIIQLIKLTT